MANKIIINDAVMDRVLQTGMSVNDVLAETYYGEIQDRVKANEKLFGKMSPVKMALYDAEIRKNSTLRDMAMMTTEQGSWLFPAYVSETLAEFVENNKWLQYLVKTQASETSMAVQSHFLDMRDPENKENARLARVAEGADLPLATIRVGERAINLHKYGRAVEQTYEASMMTRVDMFTKLIQYIATDVTNQEVEEASRVALVGDGNNNPAKSLLTTKTKNIVTNEELNKALMQYWYDTGLVPTTIVAGWDMYQSLVNLQYDNTKKNGVSDHFNLNTPQLPVSSINLILARNDLKTGENNVALLLNDQMSLTKHTYAGSLIQEMAQNIRNQTKLGTISEITGFSKNLPDGVMCITSHA